MSSSTKQGSNERSKPWIEKYRPTSIDQISSQEETVAVLKNALVSQNLPHLLFYGPPGTGKTSTILALARELYGPELMKSRILELNASDERGIQIVRDKIKNFAKSTIIAPKSSTLYPCPPYKIIILDEADSMTYDAQSALRRVMENYSKITRFCLICNYVSRIIDPLTSRCAKFRFKPLNINAMESRLTYICKQENVNCPAESLQYLIKASDGDLRKAVMYLQSAHQLYVNEAIPVHAITDIAGILPDTLISNLLNAWYRKDFGTCKVLLARLVREGYSGSQLLIQLQESLMENLEIGSLDKSRMSLQLAKTDKRLVDGSDEHIQLLSLVAR